MHRVGESIVINRPLSDVFAYVTDVPRWPEWVTAVSEAHITSDGPFGVGSTLHTTTHFLGKDIGSDQVITGYEPNRMFAGKTTSGPLPFDITTSFEAAGEGATTVTWVIEGEITGFFRLAEPAVHAMVERQVRTQLGNLKDLLEASPAC